MGGGGWRAIFAWCRRLLVLGKRDYRARMDTFITALQRISRINAIAVACAAMAALCAAYSFAGLIWGCRRRGNDPLKRKKPTSVQNVTLWPWTRNFDILGVH